MRFAVRTGVIIAVATVGVLTVTGCTSSDTPTPSSSSVGSSAGPIEASTGDVATAVPSGSESSSAEPTSAPTSEAQPAISTAVASTPGGNISETVPSVSLSTNPPVELTATGDYGNGVTVRLAGLESIATQAELPGEVSGPGVKVTVAIVNNSAAAVDVGNVVVDLQDVAGTPAIPMSASPASPFTGSIAAGATGTGVYVFTVPTTYTNPATISVSYSTAVPIVVFVGDAQ